LNADAQVVEAEIQVGEETVRYRRAGTGAPVLLLHANPPGSGERMAGTEWDAFVTLARGHRVFQPLTGVPITPDAAEKWLRGVVEGLGLETPAVVADPDLAPALARLVRENGGFVGRVIFPVRDGPADDFLAGV
jgi:hypothetical protein